MEHAADQMHKICTHLPAAPEFWDVDERPKHSVSELPKSEQNTGDSTGIESLVSNVYFLNCPKEQWKICPLSRRQPCFCAGESISAAAWHPVPKEIKKAPPCSFFCMGEPFLLLSFRGSLRCGTGAEESLAVLLRGQRPKGHP